MLSRLSAWIGLVFGTARVSSPCLFAISACRKCSDVAYTRAKAAMPATTATTLLPTATMFAAPLKGVGVAVGEDEDDEDDEDDEIEEDEDVVVALEAVAAGVVELPAGKGIGATVGMVARAVEDVEGVEAGKGVVEVMRVLLEVLEVEVEVDEDEDEDEDEEGEELPAIGPALPVQG